MRVLFHIFSLGAAQTPVALSAQSAKEPRKAGVPSDYKFVDPQKPGISLGLVNNNSRHGIFCKYRSLPITRESFMVKKQDNKCY